MERGKIRLSTQYGVMLEEHTDKKLQGGRLKATHKNDINVKKLLDRLDELAKELVNGQVYENDNGRP